MSLIMEDFKPSVNAIEEVKKLQDLVRKLEIQNLQLRNKQNAPQKRAISPVKDLKNQQKNSFRGNGKNHDFQSGSKSDSSEMSSSSTSKDEYFEELEIIRVSDIEMSDDESWLYTSPKSVKQEKLNESPYKWLRKDEDDPDNNQLQFTKKALLSKLNELEILSPENKGKAHHAENLAVSNLRRTQMMFKSPLSSQNHDSACIDTRTFTRSKKKQAIEYLEKLDMICNENLEKNCSVQLYRRGSDFSSDSLSSCHVLEDANDVQEVARMQEESLRMSSPLGTPKRGSGNSFSCRKISSSSRGSISDQDVSEISVFSSHNTENSSNYEQSGCSPYHADTFNLSDHSSPSESPYGSNASLHNTSEGKVKLGTYRSSLPNLNKDSLTTRQSKSEVLNNNLSHPQERRGVIGRKSDSASQSVQKTKKEIKAVSRLRQTKQISAYSSGFHSSDSPEPVNAVPKSANSVDIRQRVRSGLPRPSRASSASRSATGSGIPMPSMANKKRHEDSWSEGCF